MKRTIIYLIFLFSALTAQGQPLYFERIDIKDGLSQNTVNDIIQDSRGFMWFGTKDGLNRYDGTNFKVFKARGHDSSMLGNSQVRCLLEDKSGNIFVGTNAGLWRYSISDNGFSEVVIADKLSGGGITNPILCMDMDSSGRIYVSVEAAGVYCYDSETEELICKYSTDKPLHTLKIDDMTGTVWMSWPGEGLCYSEDDFVTVKQFLLSDGSPVYADDIISCVCIGDSNTLWLGLENNGVARLDIQAAQIKKLPLSDMPLFVRRILQVSAEELWIGSESGLYIYNAATDKVSHVSGSPHDHYSLSDNAIHSICTDRDGGVWIGTFFGGVNYLPERVPRFRKWYCSDNGSNGLKGLRIKEICPDGHGCMWIGTEDAGLYHFDPSSGIFRFFEPSRDFSNIHGLIMDGDDLWVSTFSKGIKVIDTVTWKIRHYDTAHPSERRLFSNYVFALERTRSGRIYIGTMHGLQFYNADEDNFGYVPQINGGKMVNDIMEDSYGNLWVGTVSNGLYMMGADGGWRHFVHDTHDDSSLPCNNILSIFEDSRKRIWVTTEGSGFCMFDNGTFSCFSSADGIPSDVVYQIVEDGSGNFWISTNRGMLLFDSVGCKAIRVYTTDNGILCNQFNYKSSYRTPDGTIYFGSIEGLIAFDPEVLLSNVEKSAPPVYITEFSLLDEELKVGVSGSPLQQDITCTDLLELDHDRNTFSLDVAALDYRKEAGLVYRMDGFDTKWLKYNGAPIIYSNMPAGRYSFRVRLADSTGGADAERMLQIRVRPPLWWSAVAKVIYAIVLLSCLLFWMNLYHRRVLMKRSKYIREYEKKKELEIYNAKISFFTDITHEIRTPLTLIKAPLDNILSKGKVNPEIRDDLGIVRRNADRLLTLVNQLLDFEKVEKERLSLSVRPENINDIVYDIVGRFSLTFRQQGKDFSYEPLPEGIIATVDREAFTKIVSNMLSNALKYSDSKIRVSLGKKGNMCCLKVSNDGEIIPEDKREIIFKPFYRQAGSSDKTGTGIGLYLARQLAELQGGRLTMEPEDGMNGFVLTVPLCEEGAVAEGVSESEVSGQEKTEEELMAYIGAGETILVVEDDLEMCGFIKKYLSETWSVLTARNGLEALDVLEKNQVTLIVSDIMMPEMDGIQLCDRIKSDFRYNHIPVVLLTAKTGLESRIEGMNVGADAYIEKPFSLSYLTSVITNQIKSRKMLREAFTKSPLATINSANLAGNDTDFVVSLQKIVHENIRNSDFGIDDVVDMMNMGRSTFYRKIKGIFDMSPNDYLRLERLKVAAELLKRGSYQINEVCYMVGFTSPSYFTKCFTRQFGETPKHFMKRENKQQR